MPRFEIICSDCGERETALTAQLCSACQGYLEFAYDYDGVEWDARFGNSMWRFWPLLPVDDPGGISTLGEGGTPLLPLREGKGNRILVKDESRNPTGSHKDRSLAMAINHGREIGARTSVVVSTGSAGISNAAMATRAGMTSIAVMSSGVPWERIFPMAAVGSSLVEVDAEIDLVVEQVTVACRDLGLYVSTTCRDSNPYQSEGNKTIAYEIVEELGGAPDYMLAPVGGGGTIAGIWRGFVDLERLGRISHIPRMVGVVPSDYNGLEVAFERGLQKQEELMALPYHDPPPSILVKIAHAFPPDGADALKAVRAANGFFVSVNDEEALQAAADFGRKEGLYVEPSSGACLAGLNRLLDSGSLGTGGTIVALISGSGFRETFLTAARTPSSCQRTGIDGLRHLLAEVAGGK